MKEYNKDDFLNFLSINGYEPIMIHCQSDDEWKKLFYFPEKQKESFLKWSFSVNPKDKEFDFFDPNLNPVVIDATKILIDDLIGTERETGRYYEPIWLKELKRLGEYNKKKILVINNFDQIPVRTIYPKNKESHLFNELKDSDIVLAGQIDFMHLCRCKDEGKDVRALNYGSPFFFPMDAYAIFICKTSHKYSIYENIYRRCSHILLKK